MGISRYELSDAQWERIAPLLPGKASDPGRTGADNRLFVNGVLWVLRSGAHWRDLPERYSKWKSLHKRFTRWAKAGVWERVFASLTKGRHPECRARAARLSRARRHGGRARLDRRRAAWAAPAARRRVGAERLPTEEVGDNRLRPLAGLVDVPPIAAPLRRLCEWTADYYLAPLASVLRMVLPSSARSTGRGAHRISPDRPRARAPDPAARRRWPRSKAARARSASSPIMPRSATR
jgi:transposase